jgi:hypothetical protein
VVKGQTLAFTVKANDADVPAQLLTYSVTGTAKATINATTGAFSWRANNTGTFTFTFKVTDNGSPALSDTETITVTVTQSATNQSPVANAGPDQTITLPANSVTLSGSGTDPDGTITGYTWAQTSGPSTATLSSTTSQVITASNLAAGTYVFSLTVKDNLNATSTTDLVTVTVNGSSSGGTAVRVNAGGSAFLASGSRQFGADAHFSGGTVYANTAAIDNTTDDALYQTERFGNFAYNLPLTSGNYMVTLHFAEIYFGASGGGPGGVGSRKFHVDVEGVRRFTDYDIVARAGGAQKALQETFAVTVSDGTLNIAFATGSADSPKVSAIEVVPGSAPANQPPVLSNAIPDQTATTGTLFNFTFAANAFSDANGDALTYTATLDNNAVLPAWLSFNGSTRTFSGTPPVGSPASLAVKVTADDGKGGTATDTFLISISTSSTTAAWQILQPTAGAPTARPRGGLRAGREQILPDGRPRDQARAGIRPGGRTWTNAAEYPD